MAPGPPCTVRGVSKYLPFQTPYSAHFPLIPFAFLVYNIYWTTARLALIRTSGLTWTWRDLQNKSFTCNDTLHTEAECFSCLNCQRNLFACWQIWWDLWHLSACHACGAESRSSCTYVRRPSPRICDANSAIILLWESSLTVEKNKHM